MNRLTIFYFQDELVRTAVNLNKTHHYGFSEVLNKYGLTDASQKAVLVPFIREPHTFDFEARLLGRIPGNITREPTKSRLWKWLPELLEENVGETRKFFSDFSIITFFPQPPP